jgi:SagB-type dehydrogenase family enzyme
MLRYEDPYTLARLFHLNSEPWNNFAAYDDPHARMAQFKTLGAPESARALPAPRPSPLRELIAARRSCREFERREIEFLDLATILDTAYGVDGLRDLSEGRVFARPIPSAGGLYPLELYVAADRVGDLPRGLYHFHARDRLLEPLDYSGPIADMVGALMQQQYLENASALIFIAAIFPRTQAKYGPRGYRYAMIEAGHVAQNICLLATERRLATLCVGGFSDHRLNALLQLDGRTGGAIYGVAVGHLLR